MKDSTALRLASPTTIRKRIFWFTLISALAASGLFLIAARNLRNANHALTRSVQPTLPATSDSASIARDSRPPRNRRLQAASFNLSRRLGQRFASGKQQQSVLTGTLVIAGERKGARIIRKQSDAGEEVTISIDGAPASFNWSRDQGAISSGRRVNRVDRELIERLVLDSPDQFVLAQLRGASYQTVASDVSPAGSGDDYSGPRWNIVRVDDPEQDPERRPQSSWRLYYLNTGTGLIDRIVSQVQGETVAAEISAWADYGGERVPSDITWIRQGQTIMQLRLTNFSHDQ